MSSAQQQLHADNNNNNNNFHPPACEKCQQHLLPEKRCTIGDPAPLGLFAFAVTTLTLSLINLGAYNISRPHVVVGLAWVFGGFVQALVGIIELFRGNVFGSCASGGFGSFWLSWAVINSPTLKIEDAILGIDKDVLADPDSVMLSDSLSLYLLSWTIFSVCMWLCTLKTPVSVLVTFSGTMLTFVCLTAAHMANTDGVNHSGCTKAAGAFGLIASTGAFYTAFAGAAQDSLNVPLGKFF